MSMGGSSRRQEADRPMCPLVSLGDLSSHVSGDQGGARSLPGLKVEPGGAPRGSPERKRSGRRPAATSAEGDGGRCHHLHPRATEAGAATSTRGRRRPRCHLHPRATEAGAAGASGAHSR
ncbi:unnamed protein product [Gadus morhua 'NCC']